MTHEVSKPAEVRLTLQVSSGNSDFVTNPDMALFRVMGEATKWVQRTYEHGFEDFERSVIRDLNGNRVGWIEVEHVPSDDEDDEDDEDE